MRSLSVVVKGERVGETANVERENDERKGESRVSRDLLLRMWILPINLADVKPRLHPNLCKKKVTKVEKRRHISFLSLTVLATFYLALDFLSFACVFPYFFPKITIQTKINY